MFSFSSPGRSPTKATDETHVEIAKSGMPWESEGGEGKYSYHPGGNTSNAPKDAPSAVNVVIVPNVTLPKVNYLLVPGVAELRTGCSGNPAKACRQTADTLVAPPREVQQMGQGRILSCFLDRRLVV